MTPTATLLSSALPRPSNNTAPTTQAPSQKAPVFHFACLFTHDIRRKNAKRWQDGYLSFHSFNGRVLVYDESRNYIGDTFQKDSPLEDGDELRLDRVGALVQVGERKATEETDLSQLLMKRQPKPLEKDKEVAPVQSRSTITQPLRPQCSNLQPQTQRRYTGWIAPRAVIPTESPHDTRHAAAAAAKENNVQQQEPPKKKQRRDDEHISLLQILKTTKPQRPNPVSSPANNASITKPSKAVPPLVRHYPAQSSSRISKPADQRRFSVKEVIDITEDSSDRPEPPEALDVENSHNDQRLPQSRVVQHAKPDQRGPTRPALSADPGGVYNSPAPVKQMRQPPAPSASAMSWTKNKNHAYVSSPPKPRVDDDVHKLTTLGFTAPVTKAHVRAEPSRAVDIDDYGDSLFVPRGRSKSPMVSTTSERPALDQQPRREIHGETSQSHGPAGSSKQRTSKPLRLPTTAPRKKLLCQTLAASRPSTPKPTAARAPQLKDQPGNQASTFAANDTSISAAQEPELITIDDDDDSHPAFEVMKTKSARKRRDQLATDPSLRPSRADADSTASEEFGCPSITNQVDQRQPEEHGHDQPDEARAPARQPTGVDYGTARLDAHFLSPVSARAQRLPRTIQHEDAGQQPRPKPPQPEHNPQSAPSSAARITCLTPVTMTLNVTHQARSSQPTSPPPQPETNKKRTFRRTQSDTSPLKRPPPLALPAPPITVTTANTTATHTTTRKHRPLRRAETISTAAQTLKERQRAATLAARQQLFAQREEELRKQREADREAEVQRREEALRESVRDKGPWSREAWDLFGGCVNARVERPPWDYDLSQLVGGNGLLGLESSMSL